jgi:hypothetical protein
VSADPFYRRYGNVMPLLIFAVFRAISTIGAALQKGGRRLTRVGCPIAAFIAPGPASFLAPYIHTLPWLLPGLRLPL